MSLQEILIVAASERAAADWVAHLWQENLIACHVCTTAEVALEYAAAFWPDLILLLPEGLPLPPEQTAADLCDRFRSVLGGEQRPVVIVLEGALDEPQRIQYFIRGADDVLSSTLSEEEIRVRLLAHLRRNLEVLSHRVTQLPTAPVFNKLLHRRIFRQQPWALMAVEIDNLTAYREVYGELPTNQILRTYAATTLQLIRPPDFIGHSESGLFWILTHPEKAEKLASVLCRQFDTTAPNFYSDRDRKRGYLVSLLEDQASRRVGMVSLSIGIVSSEIHAYAHHQAALAGAVDRLQLARRASGSSWVRERARLTGAGDEPVGRTQRTVLVVESDAAMAFLLKATLEMHGLSVEAVNSPADALAVLTQQPVDLVLMDALIHGEASGWQLCREIKAQWPQLPVIFISSIHDRDQALGAGADLYFPKPFELVPLFTWIERLIRKP